MSAGFFECVKCEYCRYLSGIPCVGGDGRYNVATSVESFLKFRVKMHEVDCGKADRRPNDSVAVRVDDKAGRANGSVSTVPGGLEEAANEGDLESQLTMQWAEYAIFFRFGSLKYDEPFPTNLTPLGNPIT